MPKLEVVPLRKEPQSPIRSRSRRLLNGFVRRGRSDANGSLRVSLVLVACTLRRGHLGVIGVALLESRDCQRQNHCEHSQQ